MKSIKKRLDALRSLIQTPEFLEGRGLSNEVNIRIFCYDPKEEMTVRYFCQRLLQDRNLSCRLIHYNLYQVFLDICRDKRILDKIPDLEEKRLPLYPGGENKITFYKDWVGLALGRKTRL